MHGFLSLEQGYKERLLHASSHFGPPGCTSPSSNLLQDQPVTCLSLGLHHQRRWMENGISNWGGEKEDSVVKVILELHWGSGKMVRTAEWSELEGLLHFWGKVYIPNNPKLQCQIVSQHHDTWITGHVGWWKTLELVSWNYWWPQMSQYIGQYVKTCDLCLQMKAHRHLSRLEFGEVFLIKNVSKRFGNLRRTCK